MTQEQQKKMAPRWLAFAGVTAAALLALGLWKSSTSQPLRVASTSATNGPAPGQPQTSSTTAEARPQPLRQARPGDTFVYEIQNERVIGVDFSQMKSPRNSR